MNGLLTKSDVEDLLVNVINVGKITHWKGDKMQFCCPIHNDSRPSMGVNINLVKEGSLQITQTVNCFTCGFSGSIPWLLFQAMPDQFKSYQKAVEFIEKRYGINYKDSRNNTSKLKVKKYEELYKQEERFELPLSKIAPYKSGKETYEYFYQRGFTKEIVKDFRIGRDLQLETVTVPVFWQDGKLCGVIGRYIDENRPHNDRFKVYEFPKGSTLFPLDHFEPSKTGEIILVEGLFDAIRMHQLGYKNTLTTFTNSISKKQRLLLRSLGNTFIDVLDNDLQGRSGAEKMSSILGKGVTIKHVDFPEYGKDPCDWQEEDIHNMLNTSRKLSISIKKI